MAAVHHDEQREDRPNAAQTALGLVDFAAAPRVARRRACTAVTCVRGGTPARATMRRDVAVACGVVGCSLGGVGGGVWAPAKR